MPWTRTTGGPTRGGPRPEEERLRCANPANNGYVMESMAPALIIAPLDDCPPPHEAHARLAARFDTTFLLESREGPERIAQFSILGFDPVGTVRLDGALHVDGALPAPSSDQDPIEYLRRIDAFYRLDDHTLPYVGGLVGSIGYDFVRTLEPILERDGADWPRFLFGVYLDGIVYDHQAGRATYVSRGPDRRDALHAALATPPPQRTFRPGPIQSDVDQDTFEARVRDAQEQIRAGEAFQIVLSRAFHGDFDGDPGAVYDWLRDAAAVPYLFHLRFGGADPVHLLGASPEGLVRVRSGVVETFPIAGTRPITGDARRDEAAGQDLLADPKETAEHAMLVDLARNDIGRVAAPGSVHVAAYQELHRFRTVQHIVSHVQGTLKDGADAWSALAAVFPAGTLSGAPKVRAMQIIDRLESRPRGPYGGAVAYASFNGDFDSCITIRSMSTHQGRLTVQAGAGIVHRSDPTAEWEETRHKAGAILEALAGLGAEVPS